ncbi:calcium-binding protein [Neptunicoccus cionae]|uniref:DUF6923 domain-containing protein n=1 Tax=Neptunicoccus cionae TaxID=2035344 RepID=A0A916VQ32_9RHOB|nr:calcium-binding protein [Amylibacter cionae]GGA19230.1 hypothetical protein GCM10011498_20070 [Amylibacter cionae]
MLGESRVWQGNPVDGVLISGTRKDEAFQGGNPVNTYSDGPTGTGAITEDTTGNKVFDLLADGWSYDGRTWIYTPQVSERTAFVWPPINDVIQAGGGNDVLQGKGGTDLLFGNAGQDQLNAGSGDDFVFGGLGRDHLKLGKGADFAEGGAGDDRVTGGAGDDLVYGDGSGRNLLAASMQDADATDLAAFAGWGNWDGSDDGSGARMSQTLDTENGVSYRISFDLAANLAEASGAGGVAVYWNNQRVGRFEADRGGYSTHTIDVVGEGKTGTLLFKDFAFSGSERPEINADTPVLHYDSAVRINGRLIDVSAFASGQQGMFHVLDGQLTRFEGSSATTLALGGGADFGVGALGYNSQDDLIYGVATSAGLDDRGKAVSTGDLVLFDAKGTVYGAGATGASGMAGDFDSYGNLWIFDANFSGITKIDVDNFNAFSDPVVQRYSLPAGLFSQDLKDVAYSPLENLWYGVVAPSKAGDNGQLIRIDLNDLAIGGYPVITSIKINRIVTFEGFHDGMPAGDVSTVFVDGDGELYFGLGASGRDAEGDTAEPGAIYQLYADWDGGAAFARFRGVTESAGYDDGAVDPNSVDLFALRDADAPFYLRNPQVQMQGGGDDILYGGAGQDEIYGGAGGDKALGGAGADTLFGGEGDDRLFGGRGQDRISGESGEDKIRGGSGDDQIFGGSDKDELDGSSGDDLMVGGAGADKLFGGAGADRIEGGAGNDNLWGGGYTGDSDRDVFVFSAGSGRDYIHDFDVSIDQIDLSTFWIDWSEVREHLIDEGWATVIDLYAFAGGSSGERIILPDVARASLNAENFVL